MTAPLLPELSPEHRLPPCAICGKDACDHERTFEPALRGPLVAIEAPADGSAVVLSGED